MDSVARAVQFMFEAQAGELVSVEETEYMEPPHEEFAPVSGGLEAESVWDKWPQALFDP